MISMQTCTITFCKDMLNISGYPTVLNFMKEHVEYLNISCIS